MAKRINIRPTTSVYATYKNIRYDPWTAIAEFVDNSTQSYYDNSKKLNATKYWDGLTVDIEYKRDKVSGDHLIIKDNAYGMDFHDFQRAIMLDSPPRRKSRSEFGMGLKTAACWFGKCWSVESVALGSGIKYRTTVDVEALSKYKNEEITVEEIPCSKKEHGTIVTIWNLNRTLSGTQIGKTKDQLRGMYRTDLRSGEIKILYNGVGLVYETPKVLTEVLPDGSEKVWKKNIDISFDFNGESKRIYGFVGLLDEGSTSGAGFTLIRYGRVIVGGYENGYRPEEIFEKSNSYVYQRLFGELNLDGWKVTQTKDAFDLYGGLEDVLIEKLKTECEDYRKSTHNRRERPVCGHRGRSRGPFYYRITTFGKGPWDARDPHKTTFMALKHVIRLSIWQRQKETPGVEKAPGVSSPQRKESGRSGRDDGELRFGYDPAIHARRLRVYHRPRRLRMASRISIFFAARRFEPLNSMG